MLLPVWATVLLVNSNWDHDDQIIFYLVGYAPCGLAPLELTFKCKAAGIERMQCIAFAVCVVDIFLLRSRPLP